jgi:hypothetical protein
MIHRNCLWSTKVIHTSGKEEELFFLCFNNRDAAKEKLQRIIKKSPKILGNVGELELVSEDSLFYIAEEPVLDPEIKTQKGEDILKIAASKNVGEEFKVNGLVFIKLRLQDATPAPFSVYSQMDEFLIYFKTEN